MTISLDVNGARYEVDREPTATLVDVLRDELGLTGTKVGCELGYCGACTVLLDGRPAHACCLLAGDWQDAAITTVEGVAEDPDGAAVVRAVARHGAVQCGFCTPGFVVSAVGLLREAPAPDVERVREHLVGNICRCTGYAKLVDAVVAAGRELEGS